MLGCSVSTQRLVWLTVEEVSTTRLDINSSVVLNKRRWTWSRTLKTLTSIPKFSRFMVTFSSGAKSTCSRFTWCQLKQLITLLMTMTCTSRCTRCVKSMLYPSLNALPMLCHNQKYKIINIIVNVIIIIIIIIFININVTIKTVLSQIILQNTKHKTQNTKHKTQNTKL